MTENMRQLVKLKTFEKNSTTSDNGSKHSSKKQSKIKVKCQLQRKRFCLQNTVDRKVYKVINKRGLVEKVDVISIGGGKFSDVRSSRTQ